MAQETTRNLKQQKVLLNLSSLVDGAECADESVKQLYCSARELDKLCEINLFIFLNFPFGCILTLRCVIPLYHQSNKSLVCTLNIVPVSRGADSESGSKGVSIFTVFGTESAKN